jgi:hypothetical protein
LNKLLKVHFIFVSLKMKDLFFWKKYCKFQDQNPLHG